eukprot:TRINITY_DN95877_c0_g1_i1.p1 TRINITY_DN95877_c0_g1~~TRINITY_DN95877_c0_g1_i1.p1  ORF type:complete len:347 (+),score=59.08 TRINITY_DN95877_c0_g1_i1:109-1041(+)
MNHDVSRIAETPSPIRPSSARDSPATQELLAGIMGSSPAGSRGLLDRIFERKRAALVDLNGSAEAPPRRRLRTDDPEEQPEDKVTVQRFTLVSRGAPPAKRAPANHGVLITPPRAAAQLGQQIQICKCSECDRTGVRRRISGGRTCRRATEAHPEYALLLNMTDHFEEECPERQSDAAALVSEACCREKTAYFILGPGSTTVGYVAAEVAANRRVRRNQSSIMSDAGDVDEDDKVPLVQQVFVEQEFRNKGYAREALNLLLREHITVKVDAPTPVLFRIFAELGFLRGGSQEGPEGRPVVTFARKSIDVC